MSRGALEQSLLSLAALELTEQEARDLSLRLVHDPDVGDGAGVLTTDVVSLLQQCQRGSMSKHAALVGSGIHVSPPPSLATSPVPWLTQSSGTGTLPLQSPAAPPPLPHSEIITIRIRQQIAPLGLGSSAATLLANGRGVIAEPVLTLPTHDPFLSPLGHGGFLPCHDWTKVSDFLDTVAPTQPVRLHGDNLSTCVRARDRASMDMSIDAQRPYGSPLPDPAKTPDLNHLLGPNAATRKVARR